MQSREKIAWIREMLRTAGLRATAARIAVFPQLHELRKPLSHAEMVEKMNGFGFDQSTIFRCLGELSDAGLVTRLDLGDQIRRFEIRLPTDDDSLGHPHFMCVDCGKVSCLNDFSIKINPSRGPRRNKLGVITEVLLRGHCGQCSAS